MDDRSLRWIDEMCICAGLDEGGQQLIAAILSWSVHAFGTCWMGSTACNGRSSFPLGKEQLLELAIQGQDLIEDALLQAHAKKRLRVLKLMETAKCCLFSG
jgi:hypothetical protein